MRIYDFDSGAFLVRIIGDDHAGEIELARDIAAERGISLVLTFDDHGSILMTPNGAEWKLPKDWTPRKEAPEGPKEETTP
jgi:hypothetical protein